MKALLVEDNAGDVKLIQMALQSAGADLDLRVANDGVKALEFLRQHGGETEEARPDFILLDLKLPRKGGLEVLAEIKRDPALRRIPVIVLTSSTAEGDICQAYDLQAAAYFAKPVSSLDSLVASIVEFMKTAQLPADCRRALGLSSIEGSGVAGPFPLPARGAGPQSWPLARTLQAVVESSMDPIISMTLDGTIVTWNHAAERLYGYTEQEAVGASIRLIVPEERMGELRDVLAAATRGERVGYFETVRIDRQGRRIDVSKSASPIRDERGEVAGVSFIARDVTARRRSEARYRLAAEWSPTAIVMVGRTGEILLVNSETERLFGYSREELLGHSVDMLVPERYRRDHPRHMEEFFARPQARAMGAGREFFGLRKDGGEFPIEIGLRPVETEDGIAVLSAIVDISERKQAEERFRHAVESSPSAMVMVDATGKILLVNEETERLFGYAREELIGQPVEILVPERVRDHHPYLRAGFLADPRRRAMGEGRELFGRRKDGTEVPIEIALTPIRTNAGTLVLSAVVDVTRRRQAEEQFHKALEAAPNAMVLVDAAGHIVFVNSGTESLFGYAREELLGRPIEILVPSRFRGGHPRLRGDFMSRPEKRTMGSGRDLFAVRKDGVEVPVEIGLTPIRTPLGTLVLGAVVDISERRNAEERLAQRTRELARSNTQLEQFAYAASHDLQEPLRMVASYTQLLERRYGDRLDPEAAAYLRYALDGAVRMQGLIQALLAYSRVGMQAGRLAPVDANLALDQALENLRLNVQETGASIVRGELPEVLADASQLAELFQNLVGNALKFRGTRPPRIEIAARRENDDWILSVADNGIGIEPQYFERIFAVFQRLHTREEYPGTGIGLAICKRIVERFGGRIWVESRPGEGTVFHVALPAAGARLAASEGGAQGAA